MNNAAPQGKSDTSEKWFDDNFVSSLPESPISAVSLVLDHFWLLRETSKELNDDNSYSSLPDFIDGCELIHALYEKHDLSGVFEIINISETGDVQSIIKNVIRYMPYVSDQLLSNEIRVTKEKAKSRFDMLVGNSFH